MPSQKTALKTETKPEVEALIECEVLRAIGVEATQELIDDMKRRADRRGLKFVKEGLTTMIYPNKPTKELDHGTRKYVMVPPEPVFIGLPKPVAKKLQDAGAVKVVIK